VKKLLPLAALAAATLALPATAATPVFVVGSSAVVSPAKPSLLQAPTGFRTVTRPAKGVYCLTTSQRWASHTPLVSPQPALSAPRAGTSLLATWAARGAACKSGAIEVRTYRLTGAKLTPANDVAFHVLVGGSD
jgi:hypothetical protein